MWGQDGGYKNLFCIQEEEEVALTRSGKSFTGESWSSKGKKLVKEVSGGVEGSKWGRGRK